MRKFIQKLNRPRVRTTFLVLFVTLKWMFITVLLLGIVGGAAGFGYVSALVKDEPIRSKDAMREQMQENAITGFAYFHDDTIIGQLRTEEDRRLVALADIPQIVLDAVLSIEDKDFYNHHGVDLSGFVRAVKQKLLNEDVQTGGSTITQQLARRVFLTLDRDDGRKAKEILLSLRMERNMSKDEILLAYLNKVPFGNGSTGYNLYGIKAAAKGLFNINDLKELNIAQAAYLAGLPQSPSAYSAYTGKSEFDEDGFRKAINRQQLVLKRMLEEQKITAEQYQDALKFNIRSTMPQASKKAYTTYPYLMIEAEKQAAEILLKQRKPDLTPDKNQAAYNEALKGIQAELLRSGYQIYTTIDKTLYDAMREIAQNDKNFIATDPKRGVEQVGAIMIDNKTGAILSMIEGRDFFVEQLNHATQAYRQPGSTMKPIAAYIPAMEKGALQPASIIDDIPIILKDGSKGFHIPENWNNKFHGLITAREALNKSYNIPAIRLFLETVGIEEAWGFAKKLGINIQKEDYLAQTGVIGGLKYGTSVKELTNAYASIPNKGVFNQAHMIRKITDSNGKVIYQHESKPAAVFSEQTAYLITDMMKTVISQGTATDLMTKYKHYKTIQIAGKTGSTQDDADAWFMGFSPDITAGVWIGYDQPIHKLTSKNGQTHHAKNIWALMMNTAIEKRPELFANKAFTRPEGIVEMTVSNVSGKLPSELTTQSGHLVKDIFNKKFVPTEEDNVMVNMSIVSYQGLNYIAHPETPDEFVQKKIVIKREKSISELLKELDAAMQKLPEDKRKPLDRYKPLDYSDDAPSEIDPRTDDGLTPDAPTTVLATKSGNVTTVTFQASPSQDVVGYRIYRSDNGGPYHLLPGKIVLAGQETKFTDELPAPGLYGYFLKAVDVAGRESNPSRSAYTDGSSLDSIFLPSQGGNQVPWGNHDLEPGTGSDLGGHGTGSGQGTGSDTGNPPGNGSVVRNPPSTPTGLKVHQDGIGLVVTWNANPASDKVKQYQVFYSEKSNGAYKRLATIKDASQFNYYAVVYDGFYKISATNDAGESKLSAAVQFKSE